MIRKRERKPKDKWHLDEMTIRINGEYFILWRAVDSDGYERDVYLQKRRVIRSLLSASSVDYSDVILLQESLLQTNSEVT